jgi:hypothetical protein
VTDAELWQGLADRLRPYLTAAAPAPVPPIVAQPTPPAPPTAPAISDRWSKAPSQWAKWMFITTSEQVALAALLGGATPVNQHINWYQSYHRLEGRQLPDGSYVYVDGYVGGVPKWVPDVGGAADRKHLADLHGNVPEIAPLG